MLQLMDGLVVGLLGFAAAVGIGALWNRQRSVVRVALVAALVAVAFAGVVHVARPAAQADTGGATIVPTAIPAPTTERPADQPGGPTGPGNDAPTDLTADFLRHAQPPLAPNVRDLPPVPACDDQQWTFTQLRRGGYHTLSVVPQVTGVDPAVPVRFEVVADDRHVGFWLIVAAGPGTPVHPVDISGVDTVLLVSTTPRKGCVPGAGAQWAHLEIGG